MEDIPVSAVDDLTGDGDEPAHRTRKFGEYKPTNTPLSAAEVEYRRALIAARRNRKRRWVPRTENNVAHMVPTAESVVTIE